MQNIQEWKLWIPRALLPHKSPPPGYSFGAMFDSFEPQSKCSVFLGEWRGHDTNSSLPTTLCNSCKSPLQMAIFHHLPDAKWALQAIFAAWSCSLWPFKLPEQSFWIQKPRVDGFKSTALQRLPKYLSWVFQKSQMKTKDVKWYEMICMKFRMPACNSTWTPNLASFCTKRVSKLLHLRDKGKWNRYKTCKTLFQQRKDLLEVTNKVHIKAQR